MEYSGRGVRTTGARCGYTAVMGNEFTGMAIAEIAGRDSVAAAVAAVREHGFAELLPTIALTGTETGDFDAPVRAAEMLERLLGDTCDVLEPVYLQDSELWSAMNARFASVVNARYGICSPCLACHLYMHLLRVPLSWEFGDAPVIAGERDTHDGRVKLSQTPASIDAATRVLSYAGVTLLQPVRHMSGDQVAELVGKDWAEGGSQLGCVLSGNYADASGNVSYDEAAYASYLSEYFEPLGRAVIDAFREQASTGRAPEWQTLVSRLLEG